MKRSILRALLIAMSVSTAGCGDAASTSIDERSATDMMTGTTTEGYRAPNRTARIDALVGDYVAAHPVGGVAVAVQGPGGLHFWKGYGYADVSAKTPIDPATVFAIGSTTKQFTAAAIFTLVEEGKLRLDDDARALLPDLAMHPEPLTIRRLLSHTSGLHDYLSAVSSPDAVFKPISRPDLVARFRDVPLDFPSGDEWAYSNSGFFVLGMIVEKVSGRSYADFLRERFFEPLGLTHTSYCDPTAPGRARGYLADASGALTASPDLDMSWAFAAGAICSTALDLLAWNEALHRGLVVSPRSLATMTRPVVLNDGTRTTYGAGLFIDVVGGHPHIEHGGDTLTFNSELGFFADDRLAIAITSNTQGSTFDSIDLERRIARLVLDLPASIVRHEPLPHAVAAELVGHYQERGRPAISAGPVDVAIGTSDPSGLTLSGIPLDFQGHRRFVLDVEPRASIEFAFAGTCEASPAYTIRIYEMMFGRARRLAAPSPHLTPVFLAPIPAPLAPFPRLSHSPLGD